MSRSRRPSLATKGLLCCVLFLAVVAQEGSAQPSLALDRLGQAGADGLARIWRRALGSGYSGIAVAEGRAITMFSDGESDWVVALEVANGQEVWRRSLGPTFRGSGGSENGPSSTPVIAGDTAYALGPHGDLLALRLEDGGVRWSLEIDRVVNARMPLWGFATTPVVEGDLIIVQTGGPQPFAVSAFSRVDGSLRWSAAAGPMGYQSPTVLTLAGVRQVAVVSNEDVMGLVPSTGDRLWRHRYGQRDFEGVSRVLQVAPDSFLLTANSNGSWWSEPVSLYRLLGKGGSGGVEKVWTSRFLKNSYAVPAVLDGHVYGFNGSFLTCVDLETGALVWRSRPPGGRDLTPVGRTLLILAPGGSLVAVAASPEGYRELARVAALAEGGFTPPAVGAGRIFVRNHEEIAAIGAVVADTVTAVVEPSPVGER
ncbi:MAG: PQQ-binding-like beta-propeller repeat protein, partial [Thermoanaerobaculia bacterium]|nr:PQQ-binding-like beta-propeller repeat protein [Thermoanaerobaculia bacterium]